MKTKPLSVIKKILKQNRMMLISVTLAFTIVIVGIIASAVLFRTAAIEAVENGSKIAAASLEDTLVDDAQYGIATVSPIWYLTTNEDFA